MKTIGVVQGRRVIPGFNDAHVLSDDIFSIPAANIKDVKVQTTIVGGRVVYQR